MASVLIVEDEAPIRASLLRALTALDHVPTTAMTAMEGLRLAVAAQPDIVLLDLGLPDLDGTAMLAMLRSVSRVPVIVISARDDDRGIVETLDAGADDYLVKPFTTAQLDARIRAVLRRLHPERPAGPTIVGGLRIDVAAREATLDGVLLELSPKEFDLLSHLAANAGRVVSKRTLLAEVWNLPYGGSDKTVDVHVHWLRKKLGESADAPRYLRRERGVGIKLVDPRR